MNKRIFKKVMAIMCIITLCICTYGNFNYVDAAIVNVEFVETAISSNSALGIDTNGYLWTWSGNSTPQKITSTGNTKFEHIYCSRNTKFAIDTSGYLWAWGRNNNGQFGNGNTTDNATPTKTITNIRFQKISIGYSEGTSEVNICGIDTSGNIWRWGDNTFFGGTQYSPTQITTGKAYKDVAAGGTHILAIDSSNKLYAKGRNQYGQLGSGTTDSADDWIAISPSKSFSQVSIGGILGYSSMAIDTSNNLYVWGSNGDGLLCDEKSGDIKEPYFIKSGIKKVIGNNTSIPYFALDTNGDVWGCSYEYGNTTHLNSHIKRLTTSQYKGKLLKCMEGSNIKYISSSYDGLLLVTDDNGITYGSYGISNGSFTLNSIKFTQITEKTGYYVLDFYDNLDHQTKIVSVKSGGSTTAPELGLVCGYSGYEYKEEDYKNVTSNKTVNPVKKTIQYEVRYNANGGNGTMLNSTHIYGVSSLLNRNTFTRTGYTFLGWSKNREATTATYSDSQSVSNLSSTNGAVVDLYAIWGLNEYTVIFKDGETILDTQTVTAGESAVAPTIPEKTGYTFIRWDKDFSNITSNLTVNAVWKPNTYTVTLNTNGGTIAEGENVTSYTYGVGAILPTPTKEGYTFAGWYINEDLTGEAINKIGTQAAGNKTYYAKWTQNQFTVTFKNGDEVVSTQTIEYGQAAQAPTAPEKEGYTFIGWDKDFSNVTSDLTVNAQWGVNTYTVTLNTNGGTIAEGENVTSYTYGIGATLPVPVREGYTFAGWYINEDLTGEAINTIGIQATGDKIYYAKWEAGEGTVYKVEHYKQNPETNEYEKVETDDLTAKTGLTVTARPKSYEGFHENQLHEDRVASGIVSADGRLVLKLYYDINQYKVTFKDGDQIVKEETIAHGGTAIAPELTKDKYVLRWDKSYNNVTSDLIVNANWLKDTDGDGIPDIEDDDTKVGYKVKHYKQVGSTNEYRLEETQELIGQLGQTVTAVAKNYQGYVENTNVKERIPTGEVVEDGSLELRLFYDTIKYTVTFKNEDTLLKTETVAHGEAAVAPTAPTKEGYTFVGWDKDFSNITSNLEVNAKWTKNQEEPKQVGYKVEHYKQNVKTNSYDKVATEELTGAAGSIVTAVAKTYEGFHENTSHTERVARGEVAEDGSLVLKLYYDINQYKVTFKDGDKVVKEETVVHGGNSTPPTITKPGYILSWNKTTDNVTQDTTFTAVWTKDPNYVDPNANDGKEEKPSFIPQTGENYIVIGTMSVLISVAILLYLKYRKIGE